MRNKIEFISVNNLANNQNRVNIISNQTTNICPKMFWAIPSAKQERRHNGSESVGIERFSKHSGVETTDDTALGECNKPTSMRHFKFNVSSKHIVYSFCNNSIPVAAVFTKDYKQFREIIIEHFADINVQIESLIRKINAEQTILTNQPIDLTERSKSVIRNYIIQLEREVDTLIQVSNELRILKTNDKLMKNLFKHIHGINFNKTKIKN